jgi:hypothetical protein
VSNLNEELEEEETLEQMPINQSLESTSSNSTILSSSGEEKNFVEKIIEIESEENYEGARVIARKPSFEQQHQLQSQTNLIK